ncbi:MAG TPA: 30S ribosomal protein S12 methylthiotransferase RimO, partial [Actinomycetes bacterium]|nr:30S ribosomal protein S12 methylthiotransferase RimO [Actinomycetes bacterium]
MPRSVALVTLGCARNEVDSEELAGRLVDGGWQLTDDTASADAVLVNTCGFIEAAKKDSIDTLLDVANGDQTVVAVGCLAER